MSRQSLALCLSAGLLAGGPVTWATANAAEPEAGDEVVVLFERATVQSGAPVVTSQGKTETGMPVVQTEIRHRIRVDDLDLTTEAGAATLVERVRAVARQGCAELDRIYAPAGPDASCTRKAISEAMPQVDAAIADAKARVSANTSR